MPQNNTPGQGTFPPAQSGTDCAKDKSIWQACAPALLLLFNSPTIISLQFQTGKTTQIKTILKFPIAIMQFKKRGA